MAADEPAPKLHTFGNEKRDPNAYPVDPQVITRWLRPGSAEHAFWREQTGIQDDEKLQQHVLEVQAEAYAMYPYGCIRLFAFLVFRIPQIQGYDRLLKLGKERHDAILLDVGCCFGTDTRKVAADGWAATNIIATDIQPGFWELGHKLFRSTADTFPAKFIAGDVLDSTHLAVAPPLISPHTPRPALSDVKSLNDLRGHVAAIHTGAFFHLFTEEQQTHIARALAGILSAERGSMIVGMQSGAAEKGVKVITRGLNGSTISQFCHSAESWAELWDGQVFEKGTVEVDVELRTVNVVDGHPGYSYLSWSVTRL